MIPEEQPLGAGPDERCASVAEKSLENFLTAQSCKPGPESSCD